MARGGHRDAPPGVARIAHADVLRVLKPGGTFVPNGGGSPDRGISLWNLVRTLATRPFISQKIRFGVTKPNRADLQLLADLIRADGHAGVRPVLSLTAVAEAFRYLESGDAHGKVVVTIAARA